MFQLDKNFYYAYLYNLRKSRYRLKASEVKTLNNFIKESPVDMNEELEISISERDLRLAAENVHLEIVPEFKEFQLATQSVT